MDDVNKKLTYMLIFMVSVYTLWHLSQRDMKLKRDDILKNYSSTTALVIDYKSNRSFNYYYYTFYFNGYLINGYSNIYGHQGVNCIGKYYKVEFSSKNPKFSNIFLNEEIKDSLVITKHGFKLN